MHVIARLYNNVYTLHPYTAKFTHKMNIHQCHCQLGLVNLLSQKAMTRGVSIKGLQYYSTNGSCIVCTHVKSALYC
jgi:hypothetical protein